MLRSRLVLSTQEKLVGPGGKVETERSGAVIQGGFIVLLGG